MNGRHALLVLSVALTAAAEPVDEVQSTLASIDALLGAAKAQRVEPKKSEQGGMGRHLCEAGREPGAEKRDFLCNSTSLVGHWTLKDLRADGGQLVSVDLEVRRFLSPEQARAAKQTALERYGGKEPVGLSEGAISWCYLDVFWTEDLVFSLWYGCWISLDHVKALQAVRSELLRVSEPFDDTGVVGVAGSHSGWAALVDARGQALTALRDEVRFRHFVKVVKVSPSDVLWLRERPSDFGHPGARIDQLPPTASCVPLVFTPPRRAATQGWVVVKFNGKQGWVNRAFVADQPASECLSSAAP
ncbi:MAG: hypothetical protein ACOZQL_20990 [Myxococcota bacterium]